MLEHSICEEGKAHQKGREGQIKWHVFNAPCSNHQILTQKYYYKHVNTRIKHRISKSKQGWQKSHMNLQ